MIINHRLSITLNSGTQETDFFGNGDGLHFTSCDGPHFPPPHLSTLLQSLQPPPPFPTLFPSLEINIPLIITRQLATWTFTISNQAASIYTCAAPHTNQQAWTATGKHATGAALHALLPVESPPLPAACSAGSFTQKYKIAFYLPAPSPENIE